MVFYGCSSLKSITIPASIKSIGNLAFYNCSGLTSITSIRSRPDQVILKRCLYGVPKGTEPNACVLNVPEVV